MEHNPRPDHNTHRTLRQLVAVNAWFAQSESNEKRFTLHAAVNFDEERLGGGSKSTITFKLSIKKCEIVFLPPSSGYFVVDPSSVRSTQPPNPHGVETTRSTTKASGLAGRLSLKGRTPELSAHAEASRGQDAKTTITSSQTVSPFYELSKRSREGHRAWSVDGKSQHEGRIWGAIWNAHEEPRLAIVDKRPPAVIEKDEENDFPPVSRIEVRCKRVDIDIYDIEFKNPDDQKWFEGRGDIAAKLKAAEAFLKHVILEEGLTAGDLSDRYSELTICDVTIPIHDQSTLNC